MISELFTQKLDSKNLEKLKKVDNRLLYEFLEKYISLCNPSSVFICSDDLEDELYVKKRAVENGEEKPLANPNHTVHFDNYYDQARDKDNTRVLVRGYQKLPYINTLEREKGLAEITELLSNIMKDREMYVCFLILGPANSPFTIPAVQITDSAYVAHSEFILYRKGYEEFVRLGEKNNRFLKFIHASGELDERKTSKNIEKRRIYIDLESETVFSVNTQYGGNSIGLKKLALRLTIKRAVEEGWLSEHMFLMGVHGKNRITYFCGAFPSMCGKTSTCMLPHEKLVGDDLVFIRVFDGAARAVNVEYGIFGIIEGINKKDDPILWNIIHSEAEIIFSNVLVKDGKVYWTDMGEEIPDMGENHSGTWWKGKKDREGKEIPPSHKNARFTVSLKNFPNVDFEALDSPLGVEIRGIIFGGRDSDTWPPLCEAFNWEHGVVTKGACLESETTAATIGKEGIREFNPMAILDFLSIHLSDYIKNFLYFGKKIKKEVKIFAVNYFLKDFEGNYVSEKIDKAVWLKWMELRVHNDVDAIRTPIGYIPLYEDLKDLFLTVLRKMYEPEKYKRQFTIRCPELLKKIHRMKKIYLGLYDVPLEIINELENEEKRIIEALKDYGEYISPFSFY